jgi:hypothetical protein
VAALNAWARLDFISPDSSLQYLSMNLALMSQNRRYDGVQQRLPHEIGRTNASNYPIARASPPIVNGTPLDVWTLLETSLV